MVLTRISAYFGPAEEGSRNSDTGPSAAAVALQRNCSIVASGSDMKVAWRGKPAHPKGPSFLGEV